MSLKLISSLLLFGSLFSSCGSRQKIQVLEVNDYEQFFNFETNKIVDIRDTNRIVFSDNDRLYITFELFFTIKNILNDEGIKIGEKVVKTDTTYFVSAFQVGEKYGLTYPYNNFKESTGKLIAIDSMVRSINLDEKNLLIFSLELGKPEKVYKESNRLIERYLLVKKAASDPDSVIRYFDEDLKNIDFTFSKTLDKKYNSKLVKTTFIYNPTVVVTGQKVFNIGRRVIETSMSRVKDFDAKYLNEIFQKFRQDKSKHKLN